MQSEHITNRYFRAGVGTVIYRADGQLAWFKRAKYPVGIWQFQQGGVDLGETIETTLWRELREEVGLTATDIVEVTPLPQWTIYQDDVSLTDATKSRFGQAHRWFFLRLGADTAIDLARATDAEFSDVTWIEFPAAIAATDTRKRHVYEQLETFFDAQLRPSLSR